MMFPIIQYPFYNYPLQRHGYCYIHNSSNNKILFPNPIEKHLNWRTFAHIYSFTLQYSEFNRKK